MRHDGTVIPGFLNKYAKLLCLADQKAFMREITINAAIRCEKDGRFSDALLLYNLAGQYDAVLQLLATRLNQAIVEPAAQGEESATRGTASSILGYYMQHQQIYSGIAPSLIQSCEILMKLLDFKQHYVESNYLQALATLEEISFIPLDGDLPTLSREVDKLRHLPAVLLSVVPEVLLMLMQALYQAFVAVREFVFIDSGRQAQVELLKKKARAVMLVVGMLRGRIPQEISSQLTRIDILIN